MASSAHAFYCFEVLTASYGHSQPPDLQSILNLYEQRQKAVDGEATDQVAARDEAVVQASEQWQSQQSSPDAQQPLSSVPRLRDLTPSTPSSVSTPSSISVNSSNTQLTSTTSINEIAPPSYASRLSVTASYPMFVTWNMLSRSGHKSLRGCIGTFEALPLEKGLETYALTSAYEDTRFSPIPQHIVPNLSCSLTLLADFETCDGPLAWDLGTHGIRISFTHRYRKYGATYLPDVPVEQGWTKEETLESLMRKAGWESHTRRFTRGSTRPWEEVRDFRVVRYTGFKASATYSDWQAWQQWAKAKQPDLWS